MDDLKDILLDGEEVVWSGRPDWDKAERRRTGWRGKSGVIKFAAAMLVSFAVMMTFGMIVDPDGFAGGMLGVLMLLSAISFVIALFNIFDKSDPTQIRHDHLYAITDNRIIIHDCSKQTTRSIIGAVLFEVATVQNGSAKNISIHYANSEDDFAILYALEDAGIPEKLLIQHFSRRKAEK